MTWFHLYELAAQWPDEDVVVACGDRVFELLRADLSAPVNPSAQILTLDGRLVVVRNGGARAWDLWLTPKRNVIETTRFVPRTVYVEQCTYAPVDLGELVVRPDAKSLEHSGPEDVPSKN